MTVKRIAYALAAALLAGPADAAMEVKLTRTGVLEVRNDDLRLKPDPGSALRCDASFGRRRTPKSPGKLEPLARKGLGAE